MSEITVQQLQDVQNSNATVLFHAPWCPHCVRFMPEYEKFCKKNDSCYTYNMAEKGELLKAVPGLQSTQMAINGFPTVIMFSKEHGGGFVYSGARTEVGLQTSLDALRK